MSRPPRASSGMALTAICVGLLAGCVAPPPAAPTAAKPCEAEYPARRCEAILVRVAEIAGIDPAAVTDVAILPPPSIPEGMIDRTHQVNVRLTLAGGSTRDTSFACPGVSGASEPECMVDPHLVLRSPLDDSAGYRDTPENATPFPDIDPEAAAQARPLTIDRLEIPIDEPGARRIVAGQARLANGIIQAASFRTEGTWPSNVVLRGGRVRLEIVPSAGGAAIWNLYEHGWIEGVETVDVVIVFDAALVRPGARLVILDLVVR